MKHRLDIPQLYQGVSEQPAWRRQSGQVEDCTNFRLDPLEGARKRNGTDLAAELGLSGSLTPYITTMRQFEIYIFDFQATGLGIIVRDRDAGGNVEVRAVRGWTYLNGASIDQIDTTTAIDTLIIHNRSVVPTTQATPNYTVTATVNVFTDLPTDAAPNTFYRVRDTENYDPPGYYLKMDANNPVVPTGFTPDIIFNGWMRVPAPNDPDGAFTKSTLPHRLVYDPATNTFAFDQCPWKDRLSGNTNTNKVMSWANQGIRSVCFHQGRLFFLGRNVITAGAASPNQSVFNLFVDDVNNILDTDRISIDIAATNIGIPQRSVSVGNDLFISCENGQLAFSSADQALTGTNGRYRQVGDFRCSDVPLATNGSEVVVLDQFKHVQLFHWQNIVAGTQYMGSLSDHAPTFLKNDTISRLFYLNTTVFALTTTNKVYVHERFSSGGQVVQLAWSEFDFYEPTVFMDSWKNYHWLIQKGAWHTALRYQHVKNTDSDDDFIPRLDRRQAGTVTSTYGAYDSATDTTRIRFDGRNPTLTNAYLVTADKRFLSPSRVEGIYAYFAGNHMNTSCQWGFGVDAEMTLSKIYAGTNDIRPTLSRVVVGRKDSSNYSMGIGRHGSIIRSVDWSAPTLFGYELGDVALDTGVDKWIAQGDARTTDVTISCNGPGTVTLSFIELQLQSGGN